MHRAAFVLTASFFFPFKVLQNLANDTLPGKKEAYMEALNAFITSNQQPLKQYYRDLLDGHDGPSGARRVPEEANALVLLCCCYMLNT